MTKINDEHETYTNFDLLNNIDHFDMIQSYQQCDCKHQHEHLPHLVASYTFSSNHPDFIYEKDLTHRNPNTTYKYLDKNHCQITTPLQSYHMNHPDVEKFLNQVSNPQESGNDHSYTFSLPKINPNFIINRHLDLKKLLNLPKKYINNIYDNETYDYINKNVKNSDDLHNISNNNDNNDSYNQNDDIIDYIYSLVVSLCDPFTQPEENDEIILSVDYIADLLIALTYKKILKYSKCLEINSLKFDISTYYFKIIQSIHVLLNATDELLLRTYLSNNIESNVDNWTSGIHNEFLNKLLYSITCVLIYSIYKLFTNNNDKDNNYNLSLNPYLHYFIKLWKIHTNIILLGLSIDRFLENKTQQEKIICHTPEIVKYTLKGSSSIRYVLAWILNQNPSTLYNQNLLVFDLDYDLKHDNLLNFIQPVARKTVNGGSLLLDMRLVIIALLILDCGILQISPAKMLNYSEDHENERRLKLLDPFTALGDLLTDLEYDDRFDEDIQYIFDYEFDSETEWLDIDQEDEKELDKNDDSTTIEFDEAGRDWREVPRGDNVTHQLWYQNLFRNEVNQEFLFLEWEDMERSLLLLTTSSIQGDENSPNLIGQRLINTIDYAQDGINPTITSSKIFDFFRALASEKATEATQSNNKQIVPIYNITNFELILHNNDKLARCMMDEMFMCRGFRRNIIWFLTHNINLSILLIDYIFELLLGKRGGNHETGYLFTRKGNLILSEVEQLMLLHEFLINCNSYLSATEGIRIDDGYKVYLAESIAKKFMALLCLMIEQLIEVGIIDLTPRTINENDNDIQDYRTELQILLIHWVGKLPQARSLFFKVKNSITESTKNDEEEILDESIIDEKTKRITSDSIKTAQYNLFEKYRGMTSYEITEDLKTNSIHNTIIEFFTLRIELHLSYILNQDPVQQTLTSTQLTQLYTDFNIFFQNFNTLCKIDYIAETLFNKFEQYISGKDLNESNKESDKESNKESNKATNKELKSESNSESNSESKFETNSETTKKSNNQLKIHNQPSSKQPSSKQTLSKQKQPPSTPILTQPPSENFDSEFSNQFLEGQVFNEKESNTKKQKKKKLKKN